MNQKKKGMRLYNVLFPLWMLILFPQMWLIILPGNFIIDSLVMLVSMKVLKIEEKKQWYKKCIFKIFAIGILSDIVGSAYMFLMTAVLEVGVMGDELYLTIPALVISGVLIFVFNHRFTFKTMAAPLRYRLSLIFAIATAPYTFLIPTSWLY